MKRSKKSSLPVLEYIEVNTMQLWLKLGTIWATDIGSENVYFTDEFGFKYYCKCYPNGINDNWMTQA
jgi:hypothetical protein